jgi:TctA family transporter
MAGASFTTVNAYIADITPPARRAARFGLVGAAFGLGFILGPMMEENLRRAMLLSRGDPSVFATRPISAGLLFVAAALLALMLAPAFKKTREEAFVE